MNLLPIEYVSQLGSFANDHSNDCGSASSLMLLRTYNLAKTVTVDQFYNSIYPSGDVALSAGAMQTKMLSYGLPTEWKVNCTMETIFYYLRNRKPILALIHYAPLVDAGVTEKKGFRGAHFIVITGIDFDYVYINDPYRSDGKINVAVPISVFEQAWAQCVLDGNPVGGAVIAKIAIKDLSIIVPPSTNDEYYLTVNGLNLRSGPASTYSLIRTIWKATEPIVHALESTLNKDTSYIQLTDLSGWVYYPYLKKK
jgi:hypothetical protein